MIELQRNEEKNLAKRRYFRKRKNIRKIDKGKKKMCSKERKTK